jgi:hypothetical protein
MSWEFKTHATLSRKERNKLIRGDRDRSARSRLEKTISRREERRFFDSRVERKDANQALFWL